MKDKLYEKALAWAKSKGFKEIKANTADFERPATFARPGQEAPIVPDITGELYGRKSYIEIALKDDDKQTLISKWKLFCALSARKGGNLYLLASRGNKTFADGIVKAHNLHNAKVISL